MAAVFVNAGSGNTANLRTISVYLDPSEKVDEIFDTFKVWTYELVGRNWGEEAV